jgi:hypothetical protein
VGNLQVKNIPEELHNELRKRADARRMSMRDYILELIERDQRLPTVNQWLDEIEQDEPGEAGVDVVALIREGREQRLAHLMPDPSGGDAGR